MSVTAFPLTWPEGFPRSKNRESGRFQTTLPAALKNVQDSIRKFGQDSNKPVSNITISSNVTLGAHRPTDPGVAIWFTWVNMQICIPVDRYNSVEANLQAIHHIVEARRTELRHGTLALVRATFTGFKALPAPDWRSTLKLSGQVTAEQVDAAYRQLAKSAHSDAGGSDQAMIALNAARDAAKKELGV